MPYRQPAEPEEVRRAAEAVASAARRRRQKTRDARVFLAFWAVGSGTLVASVWLAAATAPVPSPRGAGCQMTYTIGATDDRSVAEEYSAWGQRSR